MASFPGVSEEASSLTGKQPVGARPALIEFLSTGVEMEVKSSDARGAGTHAKG